MNYTLFEVVFVCGDSYASDSSSARGCPVFPALFVAESVLSPLNGLDSFVENHLTTFVRVCLFLGSLFCPSVYVCHFASARRCEIKRFVSFSFVLLLQGCLFSCFLFWVP